jgi:aminoglycoside phosphotransferase (APT) family kinase protein
MPSPPCRPGSCAVKALIHGDFHLGQIVHGEPDGTLRLIDVDELGRGDPRWDLARPGAWFAMGLVPEDAWAAFLRGYLADGRAPWFGTWETLDPFARAMVVQGAARALTSAERAGRALEEVEQIHVDACARMVSLPLRASR